MPTKAIRPMSTSYTRSPFKTTAHCPVADCKWVKTYFVDAKKLLSHIARAQLGVNAHVARMHKVKTLILGR